MTINAVKTIKILVITVLFVLIGMRVAIIAEEPDAPVLQETNLDRRFSYTEKRTVLWEDKRPLEVLETHGSIVIKGKSGNELAVKAIKVAHATDLSIARSVASGIKILIEVPRDKIIVKTDLRDIGEEYSYAFADYILRIPPEMAVRAETEEGEIAVSGIDGDVNILTASGPVRLNSLKGRVTVVTENGSVEAKDSPGVYNIATVEGDIKVSVPVSGISEDMYITSASGTVELTIQSTAKITIVVEKTDGEIINDSTEIVPVSLDAADGSGKKVYRIGGGGMTIHIETKTGNIKLATIAPRTAIENRYR